MNPDLSEALSRVCGDCIVRCECCRESRPPLIPERVDILLKSGVGPGEIECNGYRHLKLKADGYCILFDGGGCQIHGIKPETCVAGPFTFDVKGSILEIWLKRESICPMVAFLKENREAYDALFEAAVEKIVHLIEGLPQKELSEVLKIEEPETDLVAEIKLSRRFS